MKLQGSASTKGTARPVRTFDQAVSRAAMHLKQGEPADAALGLDKALKLPHLSIDQAAELRLLQAQAFLSQGLYGPARNAVGITLSTSVYSPRRYVRGLLTLSKICAHHAHRDRYRTDKKSLGEAYTYVMQAEDLARAKRFPELLKDIALFKAEHGF